MSAERVRALQISSLDGPEALTVARVAAPEPDGGVVIDVHTAGVTYPDLLMTQGRYQIQPDLPFSPGLEVAGVVRHAPADSGVGEGDRVAAYTGWGGYAERVSVPAHCVVALPDGMDFVKGVTLMVNYQTAYFALGMRARLSAGESLLVHGAGGGVGTAAIQVGKGLGARAIAVVAGAEKAAVARQAGADEIVEADGSWVTDVRELTGGRGADVVFDPVGGDRFDDSIRVLAPTGRLLVIGFAEGRIPTLRTNRLLLKNIDVIGVAWGMFIEAAPGMPRAVARELERLVAAGHIRPLIGATYPLEEGGRALADLAARRTLGKSVLVVR